MATNDGSFINKKGMLSDDALLGTLYNAGFTDPSKLAQAYAIARTESNGRPLAWNTNRSTGDNSYGMFQVNMIDNLGKQRDTIFKKKVEGYTKPEDLFNPLVNARAAAFMSKNYTPNPGTSWRSWQKDLTSSRYLGALPSTESVQGYINNRNAVEKGMGTISRGNSFFESKRAASEGYQAPSTIAKNPYTGTYGNTSGLSSLKSAPAGSAAAGMNTGKGTDEKGGVYQPSTTSATPASSAIGGANTASLGSLGGGISARIF